MPPLRAAFAALPLVLAIAPRAAADAGTSAIAVQGGWWLVEAEWRSRVGLFTGVGVPWPTLLFFRDAEWMVPYSARVGYQIEISRRWHFRVATHVAGTYGREDHCESVAGCPATEVRALFFFEVGLRYEAPGGFVAGVDMPLFGFDKANDLLRDRATDVEVFAPPAAFGLLQAYIGYAWRF